jgi:hypothetical protein
MRYLGPDNSLKGLLITFFFTTFVLERSSRGPRYPFNPNFAIGVLIVVVAIVIAVGFDNL